MANRKTKKTSKKTGTKKPAKKTSRKGSANGRKGRKTVAARTKKVRGAVRKTAQAAKAKTVAAFGAIKQKIASKEEEE